MYRITLKLFVIGFLLTNTLCAYASDGFRWIEASCDIEFMNEIKANFAEELQPDDPEKVEPIVPYFYKYIARVGEFGTACLVLIGYREKKEDHPKYDHFRAFSYDTDSRVKQEIEPIGYYYQWTYLTQAAFEPCTIPDVVFKFFNCLECESVELLSSFRYEGKTNSWKRRLWPNNVPDLMIGSDIQHGLEDDWSYDCLYRIADFTSDKFDDIAIRCRETGTQTVKDQLLLYTIQKGIKQETEIRDKNRFNEISGILCEGKNSPLCKGN